MSDSPPEDVGLYELDADAFIAELDTIISIYEEAKGEPARDVAQRRLGVEIGNRRRGEEEEEPDGGADDEVDPE